MSNSSFSRAWSLLLCLSPGTRVLEVSGDDGERAEALTQFGARVTCLRESERAAESLNGAGCQAVTWESGEAAEHSVAVVSLAEGTTAGSELLVGDLDAFLARLATVLPPGATLALTAVNPAWSWPGLPGLRRRMSGSTGGDTRGRWRPRWSSAKRTAAALRAAGFESVRVFAPVPDSSRPKFLVPLEDPAAVDYFFRTIAPRPRGLASRAVLWLAARVGSLGWLDRFVPAYEVVARRAAAS